MLDRARAGLLLCGLKHFTKFDAKNLSGRAAVTFTDFQKGLRLLSSRGFHAPFLHARDQHRGVIGLDIVLVSHCKG
jgi:hypothetical protein